MKAKSVAVVAAAVLLVGACTGQDGHDPSAAIRATSASSGTTDIAATPAAASLPLLGRVGVRTQLSHAAALPDRGELVAYPGKVARVTGAYTWHRAAISEAHALNAIASGRLRLTTPDGRLLDLRYDRHVEHASGDWTWVGHLAGHEGIQTVLTIGADAVFGSIGQDIGLPLRLTMRDGVSWLVETDAAQVAQLDNAATRPLRPDFRVPLQPRVTPKAASSKPAGQAATAAAGSTVDLLVGYTNGLRTAYGTASAVQTRINNLVDTTNSAYFNGGVTSRVRLVHAMEVTYRDDSDNQEALEELSGYESGVGPTTPNPAFDAMRAARETYGADLVVLLRDFRDPENDGCGIAWLLGGALQGLGANEGWDTLGYSVVSDGSDQNEEDGKSYFCRETTFAHELGHNMGAAHDQATAQGADGTLDNPDDYGAFTYSFGYKTGAAAGNFYTVMAYGDSGQAGYTIFSTPASTFCGGHACGLETADNVRTLNATMPVVAGFRPTVVPGEEEGDPRWLVVDAANNDANGDGRSDLFWHSGQFERMQPWLMNGTTWTYGAARYVAGKYEVAGIGDFDGDGRADLLWRDTARTQLWMWRAKPDGSYTIVLLRNYPTGWEIAGISDANADGRSDIHWYNPTQHKLQAWFMNGSAWSYGVVHATSANASILGIADVSGDGRADVVWHDEASGKVAVWLHAAADAYAATNLRAYPTGWRVVAVADANGDGRMDLFWHNPTLGRLQAWLMNGALWSYGPVNPIATQYEVASVGDFNGDGRADLIWQDTTKTRVWSWQARSTLSYSVALLRGYPTGWALVH